MKDCEFNSYRILKVQIKSNRLGRGRVLWHVFLSENEHKEFVEI